MNQIQDLPTEKDFGLNFNYSLWTANTLITLANVPWNSDYRDIVRFDNQAALDAYLNTQAGPVINITGASYAKFGRPVRLDTPFHKVQNYNYLKAHNPMQPISGDVARSFYYFIVDVVYIAPMRTDVYVQLDVWQTFGYGISFGNCYIERGHIGIANQDNFRNFGRDFLTVPEGMDVGNEYEILKQFTHSIASARTDKLGLPDYSIMVASTVALNDDFGTVAEPKLTSAEGSEFEDLPNGCELYEFNSLGHFKTFMEFMKDKPWITAGIISIQAIPKPSRYGATTTTKFVGPDIPIREFNNGKLDTIKTSLGQSWRGQIDYGRYNHLKKFHTFPYTVIEMTSYTGTPLVLKPECWNDPDASIVEVPHFAPPNPRVAFYPYRYNASQYTPSPVVDAQGIVNDGGEFLDMVTGLMNFPSFSVVNNGYMMFMASNSNSIPYQHQSADWSQQRTQAGLQNSYDQASAGIGLSENLNQISTGAATAQNQLANDTLRSRGLQSAGNSLVNGFRGLDPVGAAQGIANSAISYAIDTNSNNQGVGIANQASRQSNSAANSTSAFMRDTNMALGKFAANGDYQNAIAGINARVQDAKLTQPTTAGQMGGDAFNLATYKWGVDIKIKTLPAAFINAIGEFWLRYGYAINRFGQMPSSFQVMEKFTYWKLKETYITGSSCPENFKQVIRGIFEKGVTVWKNPADIGTIDIADNAPLTGVTL